jgi:hypothetical protein
VRGWLHLDVAEPDLPREIECAQPVAVGLRVVA